MGKRAALTAVLSTLIALAVLVAPAAANWTHKGKGELKENASLTLTGELTLSTSAGNVSCPTTMGATLTGSGAAGHVNSFTVSKPSECDLTGSLAAICGTHGLTKVEKTGSWALTADETDITLSGVSVDYTLAGCLIPSFRVEGSATISVDKTTAISSATFSGSQTLYNSAGEESGTGELKGTLSVSPAGTYGVTTGKSIETVWTDGNSHLGADGKLTLSGTFSFSGTGGSVSCPATIKLLLESSTVEEEEPEGEVESFTVSEPSKCDIGGNYASTPCATNRITKVEQTGTATLSATATDITISNLALDYDFEKCPVTSLRIEGSPTVSVTSPETIKEAGFSGGSLEVFNSKGETIGTASAGGSASASPSGTFQLTKENTHEEETETAEAAETAETEETEETAETETTTELELTGEWKTSGVPVGEGEGNGDNVHLAGTLSMTKGPLKFSCDATTKVEVWNGPPAGRMDSLELTPDPTNKPGCTVGFEVAPGTYVDVCEVNPSSGEFPWAVSTEGTGVTIEGFNLTIEFVGCESLGIPSGSKVKAEGTVTGEAEGNCIYFNEAGDIPEAKIDGSLCKI